MQFVFTFLSYFIIGLMTGAIFSTQILTVMDDFVVPTVQMAQNWTEEKFSDFQSKQQATHVSAETSVLSIAAEPISVGLDIHGEQVYKDDQGYYGIDSNGAVYEVLESEIKSFN